MLEDLISAEIFLYLTENIISNIKLYINNNLLYFFVFHILNKQKFI